MGLPDTHLPDGRRDLTPGGLSNGARILQGRLAGSCNGEHALSPSPALCCWLTHFRKHKAFLLQPVQAGMDGTDMDFPLCAGGQFVANGNGVGFPVEDGNHEQDKLFKCSDGLRHGRVV